MEESADIETQVQKPKRKAVGAFIGIIVILIVILVGGILYLRAKIHERQNYIQSGSLGIN
ncbi:MAG: hypothetical protein PHS53_01325 [Candidatus Pacebacteria bacterium]|nr:hypothetical protein [Candidatus Paceibacterota bacterium]MDD5356774.1 hypothetical protein [Candidatus Paceibacterota bacterium]